MPITLINGTLLHEKTLVNHMRSRGGRNPYIIQAQQNCSLCNHTKPSSLDYWLRTFTAGNPDTKQATNHVVTQLVATGYFKIMTRLKCPDSGRMCKGIVLII